VKTKREQIAEIAATLSFSAILNNDKVGCILFSDRVEKFIPPAKGRTHLLHIIREILEYNPEGTKTDIGEALRFLTGAIKRRCTAFVLSDMMDVNADGTPRYEDALKVAVGRHSLNVIKVSDPRERSIPDVGIVPVKDAENGRVLWVNTSRRSVRSGYERWFASVQREEERLLLRHKVDYVNISTDEDYVKGLRALFQSR
jgi:uncharacterized protein (DUF58 family)